MEPHRISGGQTLPLLGAATPEEVATRFAELRARFDQEAASAGDENTWKSLRDGRLGRHSGALTHVTDTWLHPAPPELKPAIGQPLNELKPHLAAAPQSRR